MLQWKTNNSNYSSGEV